MTNLGFDVLFKGTNFTRLLGGLWVALRISLIAVAVSLPLGVLLGILMTKQNRAIRIFTRIYLEFVRIMPQMVLLFIVFFGATRVFGWNLDAELSSVIVFTFWGTAEMGDLTRGALLGIPKHQYESAAALGLSPWQTSIYVIVPQTIRRLIPQSINLITRMIKTTSLVMLIGVVEVLKTGQQIIEANRTSSPQAAFGVYAVIFLLYFLACWPISLAAKRLEKKWAYA
ncbi:MAG: amino acid ABC transporter permease [Eubacterium sp.]|nr:amino acid ABC transporter permease [Eubacterium sp.]